MGNKGNLNFNAFIYLIIADTASIASLGSAVGTSIKTVVTTNIAL
jgi:hypothetical protein